MRKLWLLCLLILYGTALAQPSQVQIKVYAFEEGLSHRNVFKILQDEAGYIWIAAINGLNRFDGHEFLAYNRREKERYLPHDLAADMRLGPDGAIWLAGQGQVTAFNPFSGQHRSFQIGSKGQDALGETTGPYSLSFDNQGWAWMASRDELTGKNILHAFNQEGKEEAALKLDEPNGRQLVLRQGKNIYVGGQGRLCKFNLAGKLLSKYELPAPASASITQLQEWGNLIYALCNDGSLFAFDPQTGTFSKHPASAKTEAALAMLLEPNGDIWIGGRGLLQFYNHENGSIANFNNQIREAVKSGTSYRQIFRDRSGAVWVASDFGAIKLVQSSRLFTNYLNGGNEYCINLYCSTRGMAEDEKGNVYISYYNSIHVLDPVTDALRLLFPTNAFSNYPFGLAYYDQALWTGNGRRIDLRSLRVDTLFNHPAKDLGAVAVSDDSLIWMGYLSWLYKYDPRRKRLREFTDAQGKWGSESGNISCLYQGKHRGWMWVGTLDNGVFAISKENGRERHYHSGEGSPVRLQHNQVNAICETSGGKLWLGMASGLHQLDLRTGELRVYTTQDGLPNNFINGLLSEGDSCLWVSTDNGLSRFSLSSGTFSNFFVEDGLTANEFNRISFFRASSGRMYFGGLNGVNAFFPGPQFLVQKEVRQEAPILFTRFSKYDGASDSLVSSLYGLSPNNTITLSPWDRIFSFQFALADYRQPQNNIFSYWLEDYEAGWSAPAEGKIVRYNNIPAGTYTFRVRAKAGGNNPHWNSQELAIRIVVQEAFYRTWWFWGLCVVLLVGGLLGFMRYRIYLARKREHALEALVRKRTRELEQEKHKSEALLLNILPAEIAEELKAFGAARAKRHELATVMFSDFKGFSRISEQMAPEDLVAEIDCCFRAFDEIMEKYGLEKIKTVGDAYLCVGGMRNDNGHEADRVILAAMDIQVFMQKLAVQRQHDNQLFFEARIGIHTGPLVAGIVGIKKFAYDIWGDTVNLASRMESCGEVGRVNISEATYRLVQPHFRCAFHGQYTETEGEDINMYFVEEYLGKRENP